MSEYPPYRLRWPGKRPGQDVTVYAFSWRGLVFGFVQHFYYLWRYPIDR